MRSRDTCRPHPILVAVNALLLLKNLNLPAVPNVDLTNI